MQSGTSENRSFGMTMAVAFGLLFLWRAFRHHQIWIPLALLALVFVTLALAAPLWLTRPRARWLAFGELLAKVTQPVILGTVFFLVLTPFALVRRLLKRRIVDGGRKSHWTNEPREVNEKYLLKQF